jgi:beta-lactamase class A
MVKNLSLILLGGLLGTILTVIFFHPSANPTVPIRAGGFKLINPLLECDQANLNSELQPFKSKVENLVNNHLKSGSASHISVYFRDMNNGPWFGINEKEDFAPASLLKVPVMMSLFKQAESDPTLLQKTITATQSANPNDPATIKPKNSMLPGKNYTMGELVEKMIASSDNYAVALIYQNFDLSKLLKTYQDLGVSGSSNQSPDQYMNVKTYASFFRILFNSSYLNPEMSEKALEILSQSEFTEGLRAGIPNAITVAHKFGEREISNLELVQLHDCGIVYYPTHPYLLCIMTRGKDIPSLASIIKNLSSLIYTEVSRQYQSITNQ